ncbi:hypothetical protein B0H17DRAFT_1190862 [Mycena rosella]|uniref:Uncharacterized protein n=1 Tax=Mycena rosella TaxID=1033263 RepID=A0AAD7MBU3_MYCRO|nr:hypothetical protein B0H17DRAFT_1190862 [Mycena rosella]
MTSASTILNVHTPASSFAIVHSCKCSFASMTEDSLDDLCDKLSRKSGTGYTGQRVGAGWLKYAFNETIWNLDDDADYTIFVWRQQPASSDTASTSTALDHRETPTLHLHAPHAPLPAPPAYRNPAYYVFAARPDAALDSFAVFSLKHRRNVSSSLTAPRPPLVSYLYETGINFKFFLVRGTPGSGKTYLCRLLYDYIMAEDPEARLTLLTFWEPVGTLQESLNNPRVANGDSIDVADGDGRRHWVLIDEAQTTYSDAVLWSTFLKDPPSSFSIVLFASYGIQNNNSADIIDDINGTSIPGLYFSQEDYATLLKIRQAKEELPILAPDLKQWVYEISNGHIGATDSILRTVTTQTKQLHLPEVSLDDFMGRFPSAEVALKACSRGAAFDRGLPKESALKDKKNIPAVGFLLQLLQADGLVFDHLPDDAEQAHKKGWVTVDEDGSTFRVEFPSLFHRVRLSYLLCGATKVPPDVDVMSLVDFVTAVVASFSTNVLRQPARHTAGPRSTASIPEAQWHNEFYVGAYRVTGGSGLWLSPEFGTGSTGTVGRIDFYVKGSKMWGIEVLRDGDRIQDHLRRFLPGGAYHNWIQVGAIQEYVVLDFRSHTAPRKEFPTHPRLLHIEFSNEYRNFEIKDNLLKPLRSGTLLA